MLEAWICARSCAYIEYNIRHPLVRVSHNEHSVWYSSKLFKGEKHYRVPGARPYAARCGTPGFLTLTPSGRSLLKTCEITRAPARGAPTMRRRPYQVMS